jgi:hypothetical protein
MPPRADTRWSAPASGCQPSNSPTPTHRAALGVGEEVEFRTKPQLAQDILTEMIADQTMPPWAAGDEVYGRSSELRTFLEDNGTGYVLRVGCAFSIEVAPGLRLRADAILARYLASPDRWQVCSVTGSKANGPTPGRGWPPPAPSTTC